MRSASQGPGIFLSSLILFSLYPTSLLAAVETITIASEPAYASLRGCARGCLWERYYNNVVDEGLGCAAPWPNACLCRLDLAPQASRYITSCCSKYCTVGNAAGGDIASAVGLYESYCVKNGYQVNPNAPAQQPAATTTAPIPATTTRVGTPVTTGAAGGNAAGTVNVTVTAKGAASTQTVTDSRFIESTVVTLTVTPTPSNAVQRSSGARSRFAGAERVALGLCGGLGVLFGMV
jgi:hypothetical protein